MKASFILALFASQAISAQTIKSLEQRKAECGALGVTYEDPSELPEGVNVTDVRQCRDHPDTLDRPELYSETGLQKRKCQNFGQGAHCGGKGYCYRNCGSGGQWCWLAEKGGSGDWLTCSSNSQCNYKLNNWNTGCGYSKKLKDPYSCKGCGCGC